MNKVKLFCFPYAGGSSTIFSQWKKHLHEEIELRPIELAGRGKRTSEGFYNNLQETIQDVYQQIQIEIMDSPYLLFGHSLGCLIAYELAQQIRMRKMPEPKHIFFSGQGAPDLRKKDRKKYHLMDELTFREEIVELGGTPPDFFEHPELVEMFLPLLKNDFKIAETYDLNGNINAFDIDISILMGKDDEFSAEQCDGWKNHTTGLCSIYHFNGGHFFIHNETERIIQIINSAMLRSKNLCQLYRVK